MCEWHVYAVANKSFDAASIVCLPCGIDGKRNFGGPSRDGASGKKDLISHGFISLASSIEHPFQHGDAKICIVIDLCFLFLCIETVEPAHILRDGSFP